MTRTFLDGAFFYVAVELSFKSFLRTLAHQFYEQNNSGTVMELSKYNLCPDPQCFPRDQVGGAAPEEKQQKPEKNVFRMFKPKETMKVSSWNLPSDLKQCTSDKAAKVRQIPSSKSDEKAMGGREGLPNLKQKNPRERAGQGGLRRLPQTEEAYWKKTVYLEAAYTEAGKLMSKYMRLLLLQPRGHRNLSKFSAEG